MIFDYQPSKHPVKYKAKRNGLPVTVQISTLDKAHLCSDFSDYSVCKGILEANAVHARVEPSNVFIEQEGANIVYRSRDCHQVSKGKLEQCEACSNLLVSAHTVWPLEQCKIEMDEDDNNIDADEDMKDSDHEYSDEDNKEEIKDLGFQNESDIEVFNHKIKSSSKSKVNKPKKQRGKIFKKEMKEKKSQKKRENSHKKLISTVNCPFCEEVISGRYALSIHNHVATMHIDKKDTPEFKKCFEDKGSSCVCVECGKSFVDNGALGNHMRRDHQDTIGNHFTESCDFCGGVFPNKIRLRAHKRTHSEENVLCNTCGKYFGNRDKLKKHISKVHKERVTCNECQKSFSTQDTLNMHVKFEHLGIKENQCETCGKYFKLPMLLKMHIKSVHLQLKPWVCEVCGFKTARSGNCNLHRKKAHSLPTLSVKDYRILIETDQHPYCDKDKVDWELLTGS